MLSKRKYGVCYVCGRFVQLTSGEHRVVRDVLAVEALDDSRDSTTDPVYFKRFNSRQAASQWLRYRPQNGARSVDGFEVMRLPEFDEDDD